MYTLPQQLVFYFFFNFSAIEGFDSPSLIPESSTKSSELKIQDKLKHIIYTAETHNFPTGKKENLLFYSRTRL